jgi:hypothetical protein
VGVIVNGVAVGQKKYTFWVGILAALPLASLSTMRKGVKALTPFSVQEKVPHGNPPVARPGH